MTAALRHATEGFLWSVKAGDVARGCGFYLKELSRLICVLKCKPTQDTIALLVPPLVSLTVV
jgi:hypothetical protein